MLNVDASPQFARPSSRSDLSGNVRGFPIFVGIDRDLLETALMLSVVCWFVTTLDLKNLDPTTDCITFRDLPRPVSFDA